MKESSLLCPYDSVFSILKKILAKKCYIIYVDNQAAGIIKARRKKNILSREKEVEIKLEKIDASATRIILFLNKNTSNYYFARTADERAEQALMNSIDRHF